MDFSLSPCGFMETPCRFEVLLIVGIKEPSTCIGPWAMLEDAKEPEDDQIVR